MQVVQCLPFDRLHRLGAADFLFATFMAAIAMESSSIVLPLAPCSDASCTNWSRGSGGHPFDALSPGRVKGLYFRRLRRLDATDFLFATFVAATAMESSSIVLPLAPCSDVSCTNWSRGSGGHYFTACASLCLTTSLTFTPTAPVCGGDI